MTPQPTPPTASAREKLNQSEAFIGQAFNSDQLYWVELMRGLKQLISSSRQLCDQHDELVERLKPIFQMVEDASKHFTGPLQPINRPLTDDELSKLVDDDIAAIPLTLSEPVSPAPDSRETVEVEKGPDKLLIEAIMVLDDLGAGHWSINSLHAASTVADFAHHHNTELQKKLDLASELLVAQEKQKAILAVDAEKLQKENERLRTEVDKLAKFKQYVHGRLDSAGIPIDPESSHKAERCRIGGRLDIVLNELSAAKQKLAEERLRVLESLAKDRQACHDTYSGGHHSDGHYDAFHHGMDTIFNYIDGQLRAARKSLADSKVEPKAVQGE